MSAPSGQIEHYRKTYRLYLARLREELGDEDRAVEATVGGNFNVFGQIEFDLLLCLGLRPEHSVIDVGCGCGRLAFFLRDYLRGKYTGIDIVPELVAYSKRKVGRGDWDFIVGDGGGIPPRVGKADFICFFSVLTHLSLEDGYRYLASASRFLGPRGVLVVSFLDFTMADHWPHFQASLENPDSDRVGVQYLSRDTLVSWASRLGLNVCCVLDSDRLEVPISKPLEWQNGIVTTGMISIGQSVAVLSAGPNPIPQAALKALGASEYSTSSDAYRKILELVVAKAKDDARESFRVAGEASESATEKAHLAHRANRECILRLRTDIEALHVRMRALENEWAAQKGRAAALGESLLPGRFLSRHLPNDEVFRARLFGDNGSDLHGPPVTYYLYTSPYRIFGLGKHTLMGWCFAENERISGVRVRLGETQFEGSFGLETKTLATGEPDASAESRSDGFEVTFEIPAAGRYFLRVEADIPGKGWCTFVSCPIWTPLVGQPDGS